mgnify:CR=1 FL=1
MLWLCVTLSMTVWKSLPVCVMCSLCGKIPMTTEQICADHAAELDACPTNDKRQALIEKLASTAAKEFYREDLAAVRQLCPTLTSFERDFPSVCFALATGIGKIPLDGCLYCIPALRKRNQQLLRHGSQFDHL